MKADIIAFPITRQQLLGLLRKPTTVLELDSVSDISEFQNVDRSVLTGIEEIHFDQCSTTQFAPLSAVSTLRKLALTNSNVSTSQQLQGLNTLSITQLDLSFNSVLNVTSLQPVTQLRALSLSSNGLKTPAQIAGLFSLTFLEELDLSNNSLTALTPGFVQLKHLQKLNVSNNQLTTINELYYLTSLNTVEASANKIGLESITYLAGCQQLAHLTLKKNGHEEHQNPCVLDPAYESFVRKYLSISESLDGVPFRCVAETEWKPPAEEQAKVADFVKMYCEQFPQKTKPTARPIQSSKGGARKRLHSVRSPPDIMPKQRSPRELKPELPLPVQLQAPQQSTQVDSADEDKALEAIKRKRAQIAQNSHTAHAQVLSDSDSSTDLEERGQHVSKATRSAVIAGSHSESQNIISQSAEQSCGSASGDKKKNDVQASCKADDYSNLQILHQLQSEISDIKCQLKNIQTHQAQQDELINKIFAMLEK